MTVVSSSTSPAASQPDRLPSIWTRQFVLALGIGLAFATAFNGFIPVLPLYLNSLGTSASEVGFIVGAYGLAALVLRPLTGRLTDQFGARTVTLVGALLFVLGTPAIAFTSSTPLLVLLRVIQSAGLVSFFTASTTLSMATVNPRRTGQGLGILGLTGGLGGVIASPFAVQVTGILGWPGTFLLLAGLAGLSAALALAVQLPKGPPAPATGRQLPLVNRRAAAPSAIFLAFTVTQGPILAFVPLLAAEHNLGNPGVFLAAMGLGNMVVRPFIGWVADAYGRPVVIIPGFLLTAATMVLCAWAPSQLWFGAAGIGYGVANGMVFTGMMALTLDRVPPEQRGSAIATFQWAWDIGSSVSAAALGMLVVTLGYAGIFVVAAAFPIIGAGVFVWAMVRHDLGAQRAGVAV